MTEDTDELEDWAEELQEDIDSCPGVDDYIEVVEKAERTSKRVEKFTRAPRATRSMNLRTDS